MCAHPHPKLSTTPLLALFPFSLILLVCCVKMRRINGVKQGKRKLFIGLSNRGKLILEVISRGLVHYHGRVKWGKMTVLKRVH